jgi:hypothetical protein
MLQVLRRKSLRLCLTVALAFGAAGCSPTDDTVTSLVNLVATTAGGFVEIVVTAAVNSLLTLGNNGLNLNAPISDQSH